MVLRSVERKIESLFEGIFGRAFRTNVMTDKYVMFKDWQKPVRQDVK